MSASYDGATGLYNLTADGVGLSNMKIPLPAAPAGSNQMLLVYRIWYDEFTVASFFETVGWNISNYWGCSFTGNHIADPDGQTASLYADYFGFAAVPLDTSSNNLGMKAGDGDLLACPGINPNGTTSDTLLNFYEADGVTGVTSFFESVIHPSSGGIDPFSSLPGTAAQGLVETRVIRVQGSLIDESVQWDGWVNRDSINLDTLDLDTDLDPTSPTTAIPADDTVGAYSLNGAAATGTNWRPSSGVMGFPSHFMASFPYSVQKMAISHVGVQYSTLA